MYDIVIIGLAPSGSTLARLLDKKFKIAVIDKKKLNGDAGGFEKPCGGLLSPDAQKALSRFNLTLPKEVLSSPQIFSVKTIDINSKLINHYQRFYLNFNRHKFDLWLASLIPSTVDIFDDAKCCNIEKITNGYVVTYLKNSKLIKIPTKYIVGADGANSVVRRLFLNKKIRQYVSIQQWYKEDHPSPFYSSIFDNEITDCYAWSTSKDGYFIFGGAFSNKGCVKNFNNLKLKLQNYGFKFNNLVKTESCVVYRPSSLFEFSLCKEGAFLIGEAAGFISPSSLEGISYAINSAFELSEVFNNYNSNLEKHYIKKAFKIKFNLIFKLIKCPIIYNKHLRKIVMKSRVSSVDVKPD